MEFLKKLGAAFTSPFFMFLFALYSIPYYFAGWHKRDTSGDMGVTSFISLVVVLAFGILGGVSGIFFAMLNFGALSSIFGGFLVTYLGMVFFFMAFFLAEPKIDT